MTAGERPDSAGPDADEGSPDGASRSAAVQGPDDVVHRRDFGELLTRLRGNVGLSIRDVAKSVGASPSTVGGYFSGKHLPTPAQTGTFVAVLRACGISDTAEIERWQAALARVRQAPGPRRRSTRPPYPGLASFQPEDAAVFLGREALTATLLDRLTEISTPGAGGVLAVVGASGAGKSSLLRAGVIPALHRSPEPTRTVVVTPGDHPLQALTAAVQDAGDSGGRSVVIVDQAEELFTLANDSDRRAFLEALARMIAPDADGRRRSVAVLALRADFYAAAAAEPLLLPVLQESQLLVGPMTVAELSSAITGPAAAVGIAVDEDLVQTLLDDLAPRDAPGAAHDPGALPLLAHALRATWEQARRGRMTVSDYLATGGISGAVERSAEAVYTDLTDEQAELARRILLRMVHVDEDSAITRHRTRLTELLDVPDQAEVDARRVVLDRFIEQRLLTARADTVEISHEALLGAWTRLRGWADTDRAGLRLHRRLSESAATWDDAGREPSELLRGGRLAAVTEWQQDDHQPLNRLESEFIGASLDQQQSVERADRTRSRRLHQLLVVAVVLAVIASGLAIVGLRARSVADRQRAEATQARDEARSRHIAIEAERLRATDSALAAQLSLIAYRTAPTVDARSALLDSTATPSPTRLVGGKGPTMLAVEASRSLLAVGDAGDGSVVLWSVHDGPTRLAELPTTEQQVQQYAIAFSPDGNLLATGSSGGGVQLWQVSDPGAPQRLGDLLPAVGGNAVKSLAFRPDGALLAVGGAGAEIARIDLTDPAAPTMLAGLPAPEVVETLVYTPDSSVLIAGGSGGRLIGYDTGADTSDQPDTDDQIVSVSRSGSVAGSLPDELWHRTVGEGDILSSAISPDGATLAIGTRDGKLQTFRLDGLAAPTVDQQAIGTFASWVSTLSFSPDGSRLAAGGSDNTVQVFGVDSWVSRRHLEVPGPVTGVGFLPDSLITAAADGVTRIWSLPGPVLAEPNGNVFVLAAASSRLFAGVGRSENAFAAWDVDDPAHVSAVPPAPTPDGVGSVSGALAASADGTLVAVGGVDGAVTLYRATGAAMTPIGKPLQPSGKLVQFLALSADGTLLAVGGDDHAVHLYDVSDPANPVERSTLTGLGGVLVVKISPDGALLAAGTDIAELKLWDISDPAQPRELASIDGLTGYIYGLDFSAEGTRLAAGGSDHTARLWDITDPGAPRQLGAPLTGPTNYLSALRFSPDGSQLAGAALDKSVWVWDIDDPAGATVNARLTAGAGTMYAVDYLPDGATLAAGGDARTVRLWTTDPQVAAEQICAKAGEPISEQEWALYIPDQAYLPPCR